MKKIVVSLTILMILCSCKVNEDKYVKTQELIMDYGFKIQAFSEFDGMIVFDITSQHATFMFTLIDDKLEFISYHKQDINQYITYLYTKHTYIGEIYDNANHYCNHSFNNDLSSSQCNKNDLANIKALKTDLDNDLKEMHLSIEDLSDWAQWYLLEQLKN